MQVPTSSCTSVPERRGHDILQVIIPVTEVVLILAPGSLEAFLIMKKKLFEQKGVGVYITKTERDMIECL